MSHSSQTLPATLLQRVPAPTDVVSRVTSTFTLWSTRQRSRRALTRLGAQQLHDIGLSTPTAVAESQKPFWRG